MYVVPLLVALLGVTVAAPPSHEAVYRDAVALRDKGQAADGLTLIDEALRRAGSDETEPVWSLRVLRGEMLLHVGRTDDAVKILTPEPPAQFRVTEPAVRRLIALAMLHWNGGREDEARKRIDEAAAVAATLPPRVRADVLSLRGDLRKSEADGREAVRLARAVGDQQLLAKTEARLVRTYGRKGNIAEAIDLGERMRARLEQLGMSAVLKSHTGNLGWLYAEVGDFEYAKELFTRAQQDAVKMGEVNQAAHWLTALADTHAALGDWAEAERAYREVVRQTERTQTRSRGYAFAGLGRVQLELGQIAQARQSVGQAVEAGVRDRRPEDVYIARVAEARIDLQTGNHAAAQKRLAEIVQKTGNDNTALDARTQLARAQLAAGRPGDAEKTFNDAIAFVQQARRKITDPESRVPFFNKASELFDACIDFLVDTGRTDDALKITETSRAQTLAEEVGAAPAATLDPRAIARRRNAVILTYWLGRQQSYLWTITPAGAKLTRLGKGEAEIEKAVESYRRQLLAMADRAPSGRSLYRMLGVAGIPRGARVIVVPDGRLHTLNFETLVVDGPRPRYWIEDVVVSNASSLQLLARGAAPRSGEPRILLVGDPPQADPAFPPLAHAKKEIDGIEKRFPGRATLLVGARATPAAYAQAAPANFDFIHFVAHGVDSRTRPLDSAVILGHDAHRNYRLAARDIANQPITAQLVTISSCHGAGSTTYAGEGLVGLAWAFRSAGAQQVVAALWAISDTATPEIMDRMYAGIRQGKDPAVALREAKLALLTSTGARRFARFWAPFVVYV